MLPLSPVLAATKPAGARAWRSSAAMASSSAAESLGVSWLPFAPLAAPRATACEAMKLTSVLQGVSLYINTRGVREGNILVLSLHAALDAQHLLVRVFVSVLNLEALPLLPELGACSRVAELAGMAVDCSGSVDFSQSPFHLGKLEAHLFGLTVGEGSDGALVDRSRGGETEV